MGNRFFLRQNLERLQRESFALTIVPKTERIGSRNENSLVSVKWNKVSHKYGTNDHVIMT
jgi:hypothetical protein